MNYSALKQLFNDIQKFINFPTHLIRACKTIYDNNSITEYTHSRNLQEALQSTVAAYNPTLNPYKFFFGLCTLVNPTEHRIYIQPHLKTITTEESTTMTLNDLLQPFRSTLEYVDHIHICYIPKGKTFAKRLLNNADNTATNLKNIETILMQSSEHFIKVYKNFPGTNTNDTVIFTDIANKNLIQGITTLLPLLLNITPQELPEGTTQEYADKITLQNKKINLLTQIFAKLFETFNDTITYTENTVLEIKELCTTLADLFNFEDTLLNTFSKNLAKAHREHATNHLQQNINSAKRNVEDLESRLTDAYQNLLQHQRTLNAYNKLTEDDVKPFLQTITNSKAIEVLDGDATQLRLRITAPLQFFTPSDFETYENNPNSLYNLQYADPTVRQILHKIFVTREYLLLLQSIINIEINTSRYNSEVLSFNAQRNNLNDFTDLPNSHLYKHNCWSQALTEIRKNILAGNYELVVTQMIAATQAINVAEYASFLNGLLLYFKEEEMLKKIHIIDNSTKQIYTWKELLKHEVKEELVQKQEEQQGYQQVVLQDEGLTPEEEAILAQIQNQAAQAHTTPDLADAVQARRDAVDEILSRAAPTQPLPETHWAPEEEPNETH